MDCAECEWPVTPIYQGRTNGCGTAALAMALNMLCQPGQPPWTQAMLDRSNREGGLFSAPGMLQRVARQCGFQAGLYNHATPAEIHMHLDAGNPVLALHSVDGTVAGLHYVLIRGYRLTGDSEAANLILKIVDPALWEQPYREVSYEAFVARHWQPLRFWGLETGLRRMMLVVSSGAGLPPDRKVPWTVPLADGVGRLLCPLVAAWPFGGPGDKMKP